MYEHIMKLTSWKDFLFLFINVIYCSVIIADGEIRLSPFDLHASDYHVVNADLRQLGEVEKQLTESGADRDLPTVILAECVLVYLEPERSAALLKWLADNFKSVFFINYEQVPQGSA